MVTDLPANWLAIVMAAGIGFISVRTCVILWRARKRYREKELKEARIRIAQIAYEAGVLHAIARNRPLAECMKASMN